MAESVLTPWVLGRQKSFFDAGGFEPAKVNIHSQSGPKWPKSKHFDKYVTLLDFRSQNQFCVFAISTISTHRVVLFLLIVRGKVIK
jgi:sRNA-binding regulator protein Hfq